MKKGIVIVSALSAKDRNTIFEAGDKVTESDVENFDELVQGNYIKPDEATAKAMKLKVDSESNYKKIKNAYNAKKSSLATAERSLNLLIANESDEKDIEKAKKKIEDLKKEVESLKSDFDKAEKALKK